MRKIVFLGSVCLATTMLGILATSTAAAQNKSAPDIYPAPEAARSEIKAAIAQAERLHKRVILDFGGNWCGDCRALYRYLHQEPNASLLKSNFILVEVNIGRVDKNKDIADQYGVPLDKGVPALAVVDSKGRTVFSQKKGEFEAMRTMAPSAVTEFLNHWKQ